MKYVCQYPKCEKKTKEVTVDHKHNDQQLVISGEFTHICPPDNWNYVCKFEGCRNPKGKGLNAHKWTHMNPSHRKSGTGKNAFMEIFPICPQGKNCTSRSTCKREHRCSFGDKCTKAKNCRFEHAESPVPIQAPVPVEEKKDDAPIIPELPPRYEENCREEKSFPPAMIKKPWEFGTKITDGIANGILHQKFFHCNLYVSEGRILVCPNQGVFVFPYILKEKWETDDQARKRCEEYYAENIICEKLDEQTFSIADEVWTFAVIHLDENSAIKFRIPKYEYATPAPESWKAESIGNKFFWVHYSNLEYQEIFHFRQLMFEVFIQKIHKGFVA